MYYLLNKVFRWKYIISGLILCWLIVGIPKLTEIATYSFVALIALASFKFAQQKLKNSFQSISLTIIFTILICLNSRLYAIYQDLSFTPKVWVSEQYEEGSLNVVAEHSDLFFVKRPYDFPQFKPSANYSLNGHFNRELRKHTSIIREYTQFQREHPSNTKSFIRLTVDKEGLATIKIDETQKLGVKHLTYSLYTPANELIARATYQIRIGFPFENYWQDTFQLNDRKISSLGYLLHKNALSTYFGTLVPEQNEKPIENFIELALAPKKPYWLRKAEKLAKKRSQDMYILSNKVILNEEKFENPVTMSIGSPHEIRSKLTVISEKFSLDLNSCRDLLRSNPQIFDNDDINDRNIVRRLFKPIDKLNLLSGRTFFCTDDSIFKTTLRSAQGFDRALSIKTIKSKQEKIYYVAIEGEEFELENFAIPLYNTLKIEDSHVELTWAVTDSAPIEERKWYPAQGDLEAGYRIFKHSYNLPMLPLEANLPIPIRITKLVTVKYYN